MDIDLPVTSDLDLSDEGEGSDNDFEFVQCEANLYFMVLFILLFIDYLLLTQRDEDDKMH